MRQAFSGSLLILALTLSGCGYRHCPGQHGCGMDHDKTAQMRESHQEMVNSIRQTRANIASAQNSNNTAVMRDALTRADNELRSIEKKITMAGAGKSCPMETCPH